MSEEEKVAAAFETRARYYRARAEDVDAQMCRPNVWLALAEEDERRARAVRRAALTPAEEGERG